MEFVKYEEALKPLIKDFNKRLYDGGARESNHVFPLGSEELDFSGSENLVYQEIFLAIEAGFVRGAIIIKHQNYLINGVVRDFVDFQHPLTEAVINKKYSRLSVVLLNKFSNYDYIHGLGMGGVDQALPQMLKMLKYSVIAVPFFFCPIDFGKLARIVFKKKKIKENALLRCGSILMSQVSYGLSFLRHRFLKKRLRGFELKAIDEFSDEESDLWEQVKGDYSLIALKTKEELNAVYSNKKFNFKKYRVYQNKKYLAWFSVLITKFEDDKYFLNSRVCALVDIVGERGNLDRVLDMVKLLSFDNQCDLIIHNNTNAVFNNALKRNQFLEGPSNQAFAIKTNTEEVDLDRSWITRIDGDGPINL